MITILLLLAALLLSLGLFRRILARRRVLTQSPANSTPTAEDYEIYLTAMETAFSANRLPSISKAPRKPRTSKPKSPSQTPASPSPKSTPECPLPAQTIKPENKDIGAGKMSPKTRSAFETFLANRTFPTYERSTFAKNLDESTAASPKHPPELIRVSLCSSVAKNDSLRKRSVLQICLSPIHLAAYCITTILKPILCVPTFFSSLFRRHQPPTPPDADHSPSENRAA